MKKIIMALSALVCASAVYALPMSSVTILPIPNNGIVPANDGQLSVPLDKLKKDVYYNVTCKLTNNATTGVDMQFSMNDLQQYPQYASLNDRPLSLWQGKLKNGENTYKMFRLSIYQDGGYPRNPMLKFRNLDDDNAVQVNSCVAEPTTE